MKSKKSGFRFSIVVGWANHRHSGKAFLGSRFQPRILTPAQAFQGALGHYFSIDIKIDYNFRKTFS
jgi:hypothetical protein